MRILAGKPVAEIFRAGREDLTREKGRGEGREEVHDDERRELRETARARPREGVYVNGLEGYAITKIGLAPPRPALYARIDARVNKMLAAGSLDEVRELISRGIAPDSKPFQFIGYADLRAHLEGRIPLDAAVANIQQSTRRFAKRQLTWFRREPDVHWLDSFGDADETTAAALDLLAAPL
jgi:tRNA dimethylallyltransferase